MVSCFIVKLDSNLARTEVSCSRSVFCVVFFFVVDTMENLTEPELVQEEMKKRRERALDSVY